MDKDLAKELASAVLVQEYQEARKNPKVYAGKPRRCDGCGARRNTYHEPDCHIMDKRS